MDMDAVDGNQAMLDKLKEKKIYSKVVKAVLGNKVSKFQTIDQYEKKLSDTIFDIQFFER